MLTSGLHATLNSMKGNQKQPQQKGQAALAAAAHELKSPLTLVQHIAHTLGDTTLPLTDAERAQYLARLQFTSSRMLRLVEQLATSYRLENPDHQLAFQFPLEPLNIIEVCEVAAHELSPYAREYGQEIIVHRRQNSQLVIANRDILHDVIINLADNALRHNPREGHVLLSARTRGNHVRLSVRDQGFGVLPGEFAHLQNTIGTRPQPFSGRSGTSGLGLYVAGQFAAAMGGNVGVGRARQGGHFFVDLMRSKQLSFL